MWDTIGMNKQQILNSLQEMENQLQKLIEKLERQRLKESGSLYYAERKSNTEFYKFDGQTRTYLGKDKHDTIVNLAQKQYHDKMLNAAKAEKSQIERCLSALKTGKGISDIDEVYPSLHKAVRELVVPYEETDDGYAEQWYRKYKVFASQKRELNSAYITAKGETVKSKSEIIIADRLYLSGIPYVYELSMSFNDGMRMRYPDFFILNKRTHKEYIWEHQGKMDDKSYCLDSQLKLEEFAEHGYILGKNLIFTYEGSSRALSTKYVDALIKEFLI